MYVELAETKRPFLTLQCTWFCVCTLFVAQQLALPNNIPQPRETGHQIQSHTLFPCSRETSVNKSQETRHGSLFEHAKNGSRSQAGRTIPGYLLTNPLSDEFSKSSAHHSFSFFISVPPCNQQLWQFLLELLNNQSKFGHIIAWTGKGTEFKLKDHEGVAREWGSRRNRPQMNYEKLSRAMRYYYSKNIIKKVPGKRFVYKFVEPQEKEMQEEKLAIRQDAKRITVIPQMRHTVPSLETSPASSARATPSPPNQLFTFPPAMALQAALANQGYMYSFPLQAAFLQHY